MPSMRLGRSHTLTGYPNPRPLVTLGTSILYQTIGKKIIFVLAVFSLLHTSIIVWSPLDQERSQGRLSIVYSYGINSFSVETADLLSCKGGASRGYLFRTALSFLI